MRDSVNTDNHAFGNEFNPITIAWETGSSTGSKTLMKRIWALTLSSTGRVVEDPCYFEAYYFKMFWSKNILKICTIILQYMLYVWQKIQAKILLFSYRI
jgi:hypothetical protein